MTSKGLSLCQPELSGRRNLAPFTQAREEMFVGKIYKNLYVVTLSCCHDTVFPDPSDHRQTFNDFYPQHVCDFPWGKLAPVM